MNEVTDIGVGIGVEKRSEGVSLVLGDIAIDVALEIESGRGEKVRSRLLELRENDIIGCMEEV
jgi:hypothetical protein